MPAGVVIDRLTGDDLPAVMAIQRLAYPPFLVERAEILANRMGLPLSCCLAARDGDALIGYCIAHGWAAGSPPPLDTMVAPAGDPAVLFLHDLAIAPAGRGRQIGAQLVDHAARAARQGGLRRIELIAVAGADSYWHAQGFAQAPTDAAMRDKIALYGADARWMTRAL